ncbi:Gfo/Idh/MocA family oxidoreductase [Actinomycetospora cinnamomea]|uniref:Putative dehydrogenase n=1 Tax=Actinomycetospora cinnamomea TaxID=663609 RepID=A0A2U1EWE2_9PSEU|nr:Gfo/Idh/MocA family oxidoreductase [Actinomycetospora cinnamomea]PVZ04247.1 putative dehydrogenase [Actinomycetospora cinnamomea]
MTAPVRLALIGAGRLAEVGYVPALEAAAGATLVGLADPDPARRRAVAALAGGEPTVPTAAGAAELLAALDAAGAGPDGLVLATPAAAHLADARVAAAAGLPALVEKPPAPDRAGAAELAALAPAPRIAFNRRFETGTEELRSATPPGEPVRLSLEIGYRRAGWGAHAVADDALLDLGPHLVDLARWITRAEVTDVVAATVTPERAEFELALGAARAHIRCATDRPYRERVEVRGPDGRRLARRRRGGLVAAVGGRLAPSSGPHPLVASLTAQVEAFARIVRGDPEPTLGRAADGLAVMTTIDAVRACADGVATEG